MKDEEYQDLKDMLASDGYRPLLKFVDLIEESFNQRFLGVAVTSNDERSIVHAKLRLEGVKQALQAMKQELAKHRPKGS